MKATLTADQPRRNKYLIAAIILIVLTLTGLFTVNSLMAHPTVSASPEMTQISPVTLEEQYGLRVNLIGVTAAGGLVDVRLMIVDGEKAKALLDNPANFPALRVGNDVVLRASQDVAKQEIKFENGASIYALFSNAHNIVKPGVPVTILFGELQLEPISAR